MSDTSGLGNGERARKAPKLSPVVDTHEESLGYERDAQHLQDVLPLFASQVDMVLCAGEQDNQVGFPIHSVIISAYSPVLCQMLDELRSTGRQNTQEVSLPTLPMIGDSCIALRATLNYMYKSFLHENSEANSETELADISLDKASTLLDIALLAHKYSMSKVLAAQEQALMTALLKLLAVPIGSISKEAHITVLKCATVAEQCNLSAMLTFCESLIALHFATFASEEYAMASKLSSAGILRVAQAIFELQSGATKTMSRALSVHVEAAKQVAQNTCGFLLDNVLNRKHKVYCPMCGERIEDAESDSGNMVMHVPTSRNCSWPNVALDSKPSIATGVDKHIAKLQAGMLTSAINKMGEDT